MNTRPLLLGMEQSPFKERIDLMKAYPAQIAKALLDDTIDIGLVPVAIMPLLKSAQLVSKYVIGTEGEVASVALFSKVPMDQIEKVYLDYQSRTSVALAIILFKHYWKKEVEFLTATEGYMDHINGTTAGIIIGDRALASLDKFEYIFDLGSAWKAYSGLPFVFAAWVSNKSIPLEFMEAFDTANAYGLAHLDEVIALIPANEQVVDLHKYYTKNISYTFNAAKRAGMKLFLESL